MKKEGKNRTDWFKDAGWGIFAHYVVHADSRTASDEWNRMVDGFNVDGLAKQLELLGAKYYCITIGQNSGHYCSPNATYDSFVGIKPSRCSRRDLIRDLYTVLNPKGIKLLVYLPSGAPDRDKLAVEKLGWKSGYKEDGKERTGERLAEFQLRWEAVIREWSLRWGKGVAGWWIDGCYFADEMYRYPEPPNFQSFAAALKAGNPDSIVAFNPGVRTPVISHTEFEDYTAGEISNRLPVNGIEPCVVPLSRWVNKAQYHILFSLYETHQLFWRCGYLGCPCHKRGSDTAGFYRRVKYPEGPETGSVVLLYL